MFKFRGQNYVSKNRVRFSCAAPPLGSSKLLTERAGGTESKVKKDGNNGNPRRRRESARMPSAFLPAAQGDPQPPAPTFPTSLPTPGPPAASLSAPQSLTWRPRQPRPPPPLGSRLPVSGRRHVQSCHAGSSSHRGPSPGAVKRAKH